MQYTVSIFMLFLFLAFSSVKKVSLLPPTFLVNLSIQTHFFYSSICFDFLPNLNSFNSCRFPCGCHTFTLSPFKKHTVHSWRAEGRFSKIRMNPPSLIGKTPNSCILTTANWCRSQFMSTCVSAGACSSFKSLAYKHFNNLVHCFLNIEQNK